MVNGANARGGPKRDIIIRLEAQRVGVGNSAEGAVRILMIDEVKAGKKRAASEGGLATEWEKSKRDNCESPPSFIRMEKSMSAGVSAEGTHRRPTAGRKSWEKRGNVGNAGWEVKDMTNE